MIDFRSPSSLRRAAALVILWTAAWLPAGFAHAQLNENCIVSVLNRNVRVKAGRHLGAAEHSGQLRPVRARATCVINGVTVSGESAAVHHSRRTARSTCRRSCSARRRRFRPRSPLAPAPLATLRQPSARTTSADARSPRYGRRQDRRRDRQPRHGLHHQQSRHRHASPPTAWCTRRRSGTVRGAGHQRRDRRPHLLIGSWRCGRRLRRRRHPGRRRDPPRPESEQPGRRAARPRQRRPSTSTNTRAGTDPRIADTDSDGLSDGEEVRCVRGASAPRRCWPTPTATASATAPRSPPAATRPTRRATTSPRALASLRVTPAAFTLVVNSLTGSASVQLTVIGTLIDGYDINLTSAQRQTTYASSNLASCNFGAPDGRVYASTAGTCAITVSNNGRSVVVSGTVQDFVPTQLSYVAIPGYANGVAVSGDHALRRLGLHRHAGGEPGRRPAHPARGSRAQRQRQLERHHARRQHRLSGDQRRSEGGRRVGADRAAPARQLRHQRQRARRQGARYHRLRGGGVEPADHQRRQPGGDDRGELAQPRRHGVEPRPRPDAQPGRGRRRLGRAQAGRREQPVDAGAARHQRHRRRAGRRAARQHRHRRRLRQQHDRGRHRQPRRADDPVAHAAEPRRAAHQRGADRQLRARLGRAVRQRRADRRHRQPAVDPAAHDPELHRARRQRHGHRRRQQLHLSGHRPFGAVARRQQRRRPALHRPVPAARRPGRRAADGEHHRAGQRQPGLRGRAADGDGRRGRRRDGRAGAVPGRCRRGLHQHHGALPVHLHRAHRRQLADARREGERPRRQRGDGAAGDGAGRARPADAGDRPGGRYRRTAGAGGGGHRARRADGDHRRRRALPHRRRAHRARQHRAAGAVHAGRRQPARGLVRRGGAGRRRAPPTSAR